MGDALVVESKRGRGRRKSHTTDGVNTDGQKVGKRAGLVKNFPDEIGSFEIVGVSDSIENLFTFFGGGNDLLFPENLKMLTEIGLG